jgi:tetratricopeptide (TPR) repeat protein/gas vesicle protein
MSDTQTIGDLVNQRESQRFVGREDKLAVLHERLLGAGPAETDDWFILSIHGQAGVGKSTLLSHIEEEAESEGIPASTVDVANTESPGVAIAKIYDDLVMDAPDAFRGFDQEREALREIEHKIQRQVREQGAEDGDSGVGSVAAQTAGGIAGLLTGGGPGSVIGAGAGQLLAEQFSGSKLRRIMRSVDLDPEEMKQYSDAIDRLTGGLVAAINELAAERGQLILAFDTYEKVSPAVDEWIREEVVTKLKPAVIPIFAGRNRLGSSPEWKPFRDGIRELSLENFSEAETMSFWEQQGIHDREKVRKIHDITNGHPLLNDTIADLVNSRSEQLDLDGLLRNEKSMESLNKLLSRFLEEAPQNLTSVLRTCSVARSFQQGLLEEVSGLDDDEDFEQLTHLSFVFWNQNGRLQLHDLAREALLEDFASRKPREYQECHRAVAEYLRTLREEGAGYNGLIADEIYNRLAANEEEGLEFARSLFRVFKQSGASTKLDTLLSEMADREYETHEGSLWKQFATAHVAHVQGRWEEATAALPSVDDVPDRDAELKSWIQELQTELWVGQGEYTEAFDLQREQTEGLVEELTDVEGDERRLADEHVHTVAESYSKLIELCAILSRFEEGERYARDAKALVDADEAARAKILLAEVSLHRLQGKTEQGLTLAEHVVDIYRELGDRRGVAHAQIQRARLETHDGQWVRAERRLDRTLPDEDEPGFMSRYDLANVYLFKGNIHRRRRNWDDALDLYEEALERHEAMESYREIGPLYGSMGLVYTHLGEFDEAEQYLSDSLEMKKDQEYERGVSVTRKYRGDLQLSRGDLDGAETEYEQALEIAERLSTPYLAQWARIGLGWVSLRRLDEPALRRVLDEEVFEPRRYDDLAGKRHVLAGIATRLTASGDGTAAVRDGLRTCLEYNPYVAYATVEDVRSWLLAPAGETTALTDPDRRSIRELLRSAAEDAEIAELERERRNAEGVSDSDPTLRQLIDDV